ncbi:unnamed protein product [Owenia fusiformis]|uniref:Uncharacterized protein n=1 Tax=Owenia fusiformis TaxID=6347 RepID=A0A8J1TWF4_OWEFU|nr:unnamed protein product [Owenia fusiformis]
MEYKNVLAAFVVFSIISDIQGSKCGGFITLQDRGTKLITSPGYPIGYSNNMKCIWLIQAPVHKRVKVDITDVDLEEHGEFACVDHLELREGNSSSAIIGRICKETVHLYGVSETRWLWMMFTSDSSLTARGFSSTVSVVDGNITDSNAVPYQEDCEYMGNFQCSNYECVPQSSKCDKSNDCGDYSDEDECPSSASSANIAAIIGVAVACIVIFIVLIIVVIFICKLKKAQSGRNAHVSPGNTNNRGTPSSPYVIDQSNNTSLAHGHSEQHGMVILGYSSPPHGSHGHNHNGSFTPAPPYSAVQSVPQTGHIADEPPPYNAIGTTAQAPPLPNKEFEKTK